VRERAAETPNNFRKRERGQELTRTRGESIENRGRNKWERIWTGSGGGKLNYTEAGLTVAWREREGSIKEKGVRKWTRSGGAGRVAAEGTLSDDRE